VAVAEVVTTDGGAVERVRSPLVAAAGAGLAAAALVLHDPHATGSWGFCPLYAVTGLYCPLCGGLRATVDLLRGDLAGAWAMNAFWVVLAGPVALAWADWLVRRWRGRPARAVPAAAGWTLLAVGLAFGVARNLPVLVTVLGPH
jgi:hypothetical protein